MSPPGAAPSNIPPASLSRCDGRQVIYAIAFFAAAAHRMHPCCLGAFVIFVGRVNQAPLNSSEWLKMIDGVVCDKPARLLAIERDDAVLVCIIIA